MAKRFRTEGVEPTKDYCGMDLLDIAKDLIFHEELVRESIEANGVNHQRVLLFALLSAAGHLEDCGRRWTRLYPILAKFLRGGRLAPPYADPL
jgi:hypothetical protein